jgi:hypothetical protein
MSRKIWLLLLLLLFLSFFPGNVWAEQGLTNKTMIIFENQKVDNVFLYGKDGIISGEVTDEVVVINGNLTLTNTARIKDRIFLLGGELTQEPGAQVGKGIFHISLANENLNSLLLGVGAFIFIELMKLFLALFILSASLISAFLFKTRVNQTKVILQKSFIKTGLLGLLATLGLGLILVALTVTIIGIPIAVLLGIMLIFLLPIGLGALSLIVGELLLTGIAWGNKSFYQVLTGSLFIAALLNFPLLGVFWGIVIFVLALGSLAVSLLPGRET